MNESHRAKLARREFVQAVGLGTLALAEGRNVIEAMRFGAATASLKCTRVGGSLGPSVSGSNVLGGSHPKGPDSPRASRRHRCR